MKKFLFLILIVAVTAAAYFTRPQDPKKSFADFMVTKMTAGDNNVLTKGWDQMQAQRFADKCEYKDRLLWVDVQKGGRTIYTGAFSHWFNRAEINREIENDVEKAKDKAKDVTDSVREKLAK